MTLLPHCYGAGVTGVTVACNARITGVPDRRTGSLRAARRGAGHRRGEIRRDQFGQRVEHEGARLHVVMRHFQAGNIDDLVSEQQYIQVEGAWPQRS